MAHLVVVESRPWRSFELPRAAVELGHEVTMLMADPSAYRVDDDARALLRHVRLESIACTADPDALLGAVCAIHRIRPVDGVVSVSDAHLLATAHTAAALGLPTERPEVVAILRDKRRQRRVLGRDGIPQPAYETPSTPAGAALAALRLGFPVVVKPVDGFSSRHVTVAESAAQVRAAARTVAGDRELGRSARSSGHVLVEAFVPGPVVSAEVLTVAGGHRLLGFTSRLVSPPPAAAELGGTFPAPLQHGDEVAATCVAALDSLGVTHGFTHTEMILGPGGPVMVEVNGRLGGGPVPELMVAAGGVNPYTILTRVALGEPVGRVGMPSAVAAVRAYVAPVAGVVRGVHLSPRLHEPGVVLHDLDAPMGRVVAPPRDNVHRLGFVITTGHTAADAEGLAERILTETSIDIVPEGRPRDERPVA
jgi:biotin carboxylase